MHLNPDDIRLVYMPENEITEAIGRVDVLTGVWFLVHPERGLVFYQFAGRNRRGKFAGTTPQCNSNESISRRVAQAIMPWAEVKFFETVHVPVNPADY